MKGTVSKRKSLNLLNSINSQKSFMIFIWVYFTVLRFSKREIFLVGGGNMMDSIFAFTLSIQSLEMCLRKCMYLTFFFTKISQTPPKDEDCPFGPGSCPVTLDNVVDVYFHDVDDIRSCQRECRQIEDCKFFTMKPESDDPHDHMKCFLFKTCDHLEACEQCITGINQVFNWEQLLCYILKLYHFITSFMYTDLSLRTNFSFLL